MVVCPACRTLKFVRRDLMDFSVGYLWRCACSRFQAEFEAPNRTMKVEEGMYWMCVKPIVQRTPDLGHYMRFVRGHLWECQRGESTDLVPRAAAEGRIGDFADLMQVSAVLDS